MWNEKLSATNIFKKSEQSTRAQNGEGSARDPSFGTSSIIKTFYEGPNSCNGYYNWVETPPKQLKKKIALAYDRVAIKVHKIRDSEQTTISGHTPLKIHMIHIQSPILIEAIKDILKEESVFLDASEVAIFVEPFKPLYFCNDKIMALHRRTDDNTILKQHLSLLVQVMGDIFGSLIAQLKHLNIGELISYKLAWTYFPRNSTVFCGTGDCERLCRVVDTQYVTTPPQMEIRAQELCFDGESFVWKPVTLAVPLFSGNLPITELPSYPLSFHKDKEGVKGRLSARGKKVLDYQELVYCEYAGIGIYKDACETKKHNVSI